MTEKELHGTATGYGVLLGCLGAGAVMAAVLLAKFRMRYSPDQIVIGAGVLWGLATLSLGFVTSFALAAVAMLAAGIAWVSEMSSFNVTAQTALPAWVRARALAVYLLVFQGGMALSSVLWGIVAGKIRNSHQLRCRRDRLAIYAPAGKTFSLASRGRTRDHNV